MYTVPLKLKQIFKKVYYLLDLSQFLELDKTSLRVAISSFVEVVKFLALRVDKITAEKCHNINNYIWISFKLHQVFSRSSAI